MPKRNVTTIRRPLAAMLTRDWQTKEGDGMTGNLVVICDDGAAFNYSWDEGQWREMAPVPGTQREPIKAREDAEYETGAKKRIDAGIRAAQERFAQRRTARD